MYIISPNAKIIINDSKTALCNIKTGAFVRTSKVYYEYLNEIIKQNETLDKVELPDKIKQNLKMLFRELCRIRFYILEEEAENDTMENYQIIYLSVTNRCNLKCKHCVASSSMDEIDVLGTEEWKHIIDQVIELKPEQINFTGGEPLVRNDITELLNYTRHHYKGFITLSTNGLLVNNTNIGVIKETVDLVSVSLDGYDEESCSKVRGDGIFDKVVQAIRFIKEAGIDKVSVSMLRTQYTAGHDEDFQELCKSLNVKHMIRRFTPTGRGKLNHKELMPMVDPIKHMEKKDLSCRLCKPGRKELNIAANGDVYPCSPLSGKAELCMGNMSESSLTGIIEEYSFDKGIEPLRPWNMDICKECNVNLFCHSCINYILGIRSNPEMFETICHQQRKKLQKLVWEE